MEQNWMQLMDQQNQLSRVMETNRTAQTYGLMLSEQDAKLLLKERGRALKKEKRVEFGEGILPKMIYEFCDCPYLNQEHYVETLVRLQDIFYLYKNEMLDEITDDELLNFMREQYETVCLGIWTIWRGLVWIFSHRRSGPDTGDIRKAEETGNMKT